MSIILTLIKIQYLTLRVYRWFGPFTKVFFDKLTELISQKLFILKNTLRDHFEFDSNLIQSTYAHTYTFNTCKDPKKHSERIFSLNFRHFLVFFCVRLQRSNTNNALAAVSWKFAFGGQKREKTKNFEKLSLENSVHKYLLY
jgi:hypothetical protein